MLILWGSCSPNLSSNLNRWFGMCFKSLQLCLWCQTMSKLYTNTWDLGKDWQCDRIFFRILYYWKPMLKMASVMYVIGPRFSHHLTFKHIWTNHSFKDNKRCALVGTKTSIDNIKNNNTILNVSMSCLPIIILCNFGIYCTSY